jgi:hypothetical protein
VWSLLYGFESRVKSSELFFWVHAICYIRIFPSFFFREVFFSGEVIGFVAYFFVQFSLVLLEKDF